MKYPPVLLLDSVNVSTFLAALHEINYLISFNDFEVDIDSEYSLCLDGDPFVSFYAKIDENGKKITVREGNIDVPAGTIVAKTGTGFCRLLYSYLNGLKKKQEYLDKTKYLK